MPEKPFKIFVVEDSEWYNKLLVYTLSLNPDYEIKSFFNGAPVFFTENDKVRPVFPFNLQSFMVSDAVIYFIFSVFLNSLAVVSSMILSLGYCVQYGIPVLLLREGTS